MQAQQIRQIVREVQVGEARNLSLNQDMSQAAITDRRRINSIGGMTSFAIVIEIHKIKEQNNLVATWIIIHQKYFALSDYSNFAMHLLTHAFLKYSRIQKFEQEKQGMRIAFQKAKKNNFLSLFVVTAIVERQGCHLFWNILGQVYCIQFNENFQAFQGLSCLKGWGTKLDAFSVQKLHSFCLKQFQHIGLSSKNIQIVSLSSPRSGLKASQASSLKAICQAQNQINVSEVGKGTFFLMLEIFEADSKLYSSVRQQLRCWGYLSTWLYFLTQFFVFILQHHQFIYIKSQFLSRKKGLFNQFQAASSCISAATQIFTLCFSPPFNNGNYFRSLISRSILLSFDSNIEPSNSRFIKIIINSTIKTDPWHLPSAHSTIRPVLSLFFQYFQAKPTKTINYTMIIPNKTKFVEDNFLVFTRTLSNYKFFGSPAPGKTKQKSSANFRILKQSRKIQKILGSVLGRLLKFLLDLYFINFQIASMKAQNKDKKDKVAGYDQITKGQYELHVLIESTSGLSLESDSSVDAKIAITAFGKTEYTKVKSGVGVEETFWGQHVYFKTQFQNSLSAENQRLLVAVYDFNKFSANSLVGSYQIDIQRIYSEPHHTLQHSWLALSNIERNYTEITGYIKISASLLGQKDTNIELDVEPVASITKQKKVLIPPQIQRKIYQITVDVLEGKNIKPADGDTVDSYLGIEFGQIYSVSETIPKDCNPNYKTRVYVPMSLPAVVENIAFRLNDFNYFQRVEVLGSYYLNINELIKNYQNPPPPPKDPAIKPNIVFENKNPLNQFRWVNFYGPQMYTNQDIQKNVQQLYPKLAAAYCGSVLMRVNIKQNSQPQIKKEQLSPDEIKAFALDKVAPPFVFRLTAKIVAAINLFDKNRKYKVVVRVGAKQMQTDYIQAKNGFCFWSVEKSFKIFVTPIQTMPDIFVYLANDKNQRICYLRYQPKPGVIQQDEWVSLKPDTAMVNMQAQQGGYLKFSLDLKEQLNTKEQAPVTRKIPHPLSDAYNLNKKSGQIVIDLLCGQSLIPLDTDGGIDAFFTFNYMQSEVTSSVKNDTLNPVYYQRLIIEGDILDEEGCPPIIVNAYDKDKVSNQFLGSTFIDVGVGIKNKSLVYGFRSDPEPFWYELTQNGMTTGRFLISIRLLPNYNQKFPREITIAKKDYQVNLVIMGLRALKHTGMLSVKQPFIEFDFAGLDIQKNTSKQVQQSRMIKTEPKQKGRNINISTVIPAKISLPSNYKLWPSLSAKVKDNVLGDLYQPTLGYFSINLQTAYLRSAEIRQAFKNRRKVLLQNKTKIVERPPKLEGIHQGLLMNLRNFVMKSLNYNWQILEPSMQKQLIQKKPLKKINDEYVIIFPNYMKESLGKVQKDGKEEQKFKYVEKYKDIILKNGNYMQIGYDDIKSRGSGTSKRNKHYRYVLSESYEQYFERINGHRLGLMDQIPIRVGRVFTSNDLVSNVLRNVSHEDMVAGKYKGQLFISEYKEIKTQQEQEFKQQSLSLLNNLLRKGKICMYLYVIEAANLPPKDNFSHSDPYLVVRAGNQKVSFEKQYINDEPNPQFFKKIEMILEFPEDSTIDIEVWDYDPIVGDQLIGSVTLDIEDRVQVKLSNVRFNSPIETHNLMCETSKRSQGLLRFWLDLVPYENKSLYRQFDIKNAPAQKFEVRIIIWSVTEMPCNDIEDMSDLYVKCMFNDQIQDSDVHYRSSSGDGSFNWRMVFPVKLPIKNSMVTFRVYDKDLVTGDDYLASASFNIQEYLEEAFETNSSVTLMLGTEDLAKQSDVPGGKMHLINNQPRYDRFWINTNNRTEENPGTLQNQGKIQISLQILTEDEAKRTPAGNGRQDPNQHPYLPKPKGRFKFSLNPMTMLGQLCGPKFKRKAACAICCLIFFLLVIYGGVTFGGGLVGALVGRIVAG